MTSLKVARRYARAMLGLSQDNAEREKWGVELEQLARVFEQADVVAAFASPEVTPSSKLAAINKIAERLELSYPMRSFVAVLTRHGRADDTPAVADAYRTMLDQLMGRARAHLTFATSPQPGDIERVVHSLEAIAHKTIIPTINVNSALIGGMIAELEGKTYDGSVANRLTELARRMAG